MELKTTGMVGTFFFDPNFGPLFFFPLCGKCCAILSFPVITSGSLCTEWLTLHERVFESILNLGLWQTKQTHRRMGI
jgi:hypothetical protein